MSRWDPALVAVAAALIAVASAGWRTRNEELAKLRLTERADLVELVARWIVEVEALNRGVGRPPWGGSDIEIHKMLHERCSAVLKISWNLYPWERSVLRRLCVQIFGKQVFLLANRIPSYVLRDEERPDEFAMFFMVLGEGTTRPRGVTEYDHGLMGELLWHYHDYYSAKQTSREIHATGSPRLQKRYDNLLAALQRLQRPRRRDVVLLNPYLENLRAQLLRKGKGRIGGSQR